MQNYGHPPLAPSKVLYTYSPRQSFKRDLWSHLSNPYTKKVLTFLFPSVIVCMISILFPRTSPTVQAYEVQPIVVASSYSEDTEAIPSPTSTPTGDQIVVDIPFPLGTRVEVSPTPIPPAIAESPTVQSVPVIQFVRPVFGRITQSFARYHGAVDIADSSAPDIVAAESGTVIFASCVIGGYGCHIEIAHAEGYQTLYGHLSRLYVGVGESVAKGQAIGKMGATGRATGIHLHFEIKKDGILQNPLNFI